MDWAGLLASLQITSKFHWAPALWGYSVVEHVEFCANREQVLNRLIEENNMSLETTDSYRKESNHSIFGDVVRYEFDGQHRSASKWLEESGILYRFIATIAYAPLLTWTKAAQR